MRFAEVCGVESILIFRVGQVALVTSADFSFALS